MFLAIFCGCTVCCGLVCFGPALAGSPASLLKILMNNLLVGVICFISTLYINWQVNMVIVSRLEGMGIFSSCRVYFNFFLTKTYLIMCSDMLFHPNVFSCDILAFCSEPLLIENTLGISYQNLGSDKATSYALIRWKFGRFSKITVYGYVKGDRTVLI